MSKTMSKPRKRLTREESRAQTRATLMAVGREHFIRYGLGGAVAEKIAEDAGYSRGALYSNFDGKEELFLAVIREEQDRRTEALHSMFKEEPSAKERLRKMREAIADLVTDPDWIVLRAEFEAGALRAGCNVMPPPSAIQSRHRKRRCLELEPGPRGGKYCNISNFASAGACSSNLLNADFSGTSGMLSDCR
jgi:AcrR family transcriptional regulator